MKNKPRARDLGIPFGDMQPGANNAITDVPGVLAAEFTVHKDDFHTGFTVVTPHPGNLFQEKLFAGCHVQNGFGKSMGVVQLAELGTLETPIVLTNTFAVGTCFQALVEYSVARNPEIGRTIGSVNPVVLEVADGTLSDMQKQAFTTEDVIKTVESAGPSGPAEGNAGGGAGARALGYKSGIGTSSRVVEVAGNTYTLGVVVQPNFGQDRGTVLKIRGKAFPRKEETHDRDVGRAGGSCAFVVATDAPLLSFQLSRLASRALAVIPLVGSKLDHMSGDLAVAFSTAVRLPHDLPRRPEAMTWDVGRVLSHEATNPLFEAVLDAGEEAIVNALVAAETLTGRNGYTEEAIEHERLKRAFN